MRVLVLSPVTLDTPRSISFATVQLIQSIADLGHQVDVLCCQQGSTLLSRTSPGNLATDCAYAIQRWRAHSLLLRKWLYYPARRQVQLIHSIDGTVVPAAMCQMLFGIPFVHSMFNAQSDEYDISRQSQFYRASGWELWASARSLGVFVHCQSLAELAVRRNRNVPVIRADLTRVDSTESHRTQSIENWPTTGEQVVMYVGEIGRDQRLLLDAFTYLVHYRANVKLILIGGSLRDVKRGQARAQTLGIANR
ncbi:MAG: hypothetical protein O2931_10910, partial [Planctomycetota bacterium]|nr:hypothetical protein [Planctomycetota bacterium]